MIFHEPRKISLLLMRCGEFIFHFLMQFLLENYYAWTNSSKKNGSCPYPWGGATSKLQNKGEQKHVSDSDTLNELKFCEDS